MEKTTNETKIKKSLNKIFRDIHLEYPNEPTPSWLYSLAICVEGDYPLDGDENQTIEIFDILWRFDITLTQLCGYYMDYCSDPRELKRIEHARMSLYGH
jgi:hypothetical protein